MKTKDQIELLAIKSSEKRRLENRDYRIGFEDGYKMAQKSVCSKCGGIDEYCNNCGTKIKSN